MYEVFEHTADVGLRVRAADLNSLFADAARGLFSLMVENLDVAQPQESVNLEIEAGNLEDLLFDWLAELLYTAESRRLALCQFDIQVENTGLRATVAGEPIDPAKHQFNQEIKAITYHGLFVRRDSDGWLAEVIVDL